MTVYALKIHYREDEPPIHVPLPGADADQAEIARQALVHRVEHARDIGDPEIYATDGSPGRDVAVDPARVTAVDLVEDTPDART